MLAQTLKAEGRRDQALAEAQLAADLNNGKNPEVAQVLRALAQDK